VEWVTASIAVISILVSAAVAVVTISAKERESGRSIRAVQDHGDWSAIDSVSLDVLAQLLVYADFEVYRQGDFLRGEYEQTVENLEKCRDALSTQSRMQFAEGDR
jgi:hypothetical protein